MNEAANDAAPDAAEAESYGRLERDLKAVKTDIAHLSQQIVEAVNALGTVAEAQGRRGVRRARGQVDALASDASDRAASLANAAESAASSMGDTLAEAIQERPLAAAMSVGFVIGVTWRR